MTSPRRNIPLVLVTGTTETTAGRSRVVVHEAYTNAIAEAGLIPVVLPPLDAEMAVATLHAVAGLALTGGEDVDPETFGEAPHPAAGVPHSVRDRGEIALSVAARERKLPTLALCRGIHIMNVALGGSLIQDIPSQARGGTAHPSSRHRAERVHEVEIVKDSRLASIVGDERINVNSSHHQAIGRLASPLRVVAKSADGIVEGIEPVDQDWWMVGVQWHPEDLTDTPEEWDRRIFAAFAREVRR